LIFFLILSAISTAIASSISLYQAKNSGRDKVVSAGAMSDHLALANLFK
jgi:uncharacterized membrane protein